MKNRQPHEQKKTIEATCKVCGDDYYQEYMVGNVCQFCKEKKRFAVFAESCGLKRFPSPDGERYVYYLEGTFAGKKSELTDFINELWNALATEKNRPDMLIK